MARNTSGAIVRSDGSLWVGPVHLADARIADARELLKDLGTPGVCLVLGAGASHGLVPLSRKDIAAVAWEVIRRQGNFNTIPIRHRQQLEEYPELASLVDLLKEFPPDAWERFLVDVPDLLPLARPIGIRSNSFAGFLTAAPEALSPAQASVVWNEVFTPRNDVPRALIDIYAVLECRGGHIVCYNYDRIVEGQRRFPVISPHGRRPSLLANPRSREAVRRLAWEAHVPIPTDWHLLFPEDDRVYARSEYQKAVAIWRAARSVVFVGYSFGGGADGLSFREFAENLNPGARVHVLCPPPDNKDLCKQIGWALRGRPRGFRVFGQPFRWRAFAEAVLQLLRKTGRTRIDELLALEPELLREHDGR
jgi:hypothetical protein